MSATERPVLRCNLTSTFGGKRRPNLLLRLCFGSTLSYIDTTAIPLSTIGSPAFYEIFSELLHRADGLQEECHKHRFGSFDQSFAAMMEGQSNGCEYMLCEISRSRRRHRLRLPASGTKSGLWIQVGGSGQIQHGRASRQSTI